MPKVRHLVLAICAIASLAGCGYHFQETHNPLVDLGIRRIYVKEFKNDTYRPGIEHFFSTAMVREIGRSKSFELVNSAADADAVLSGLVTSATSAVSATKNIRKAESGMDRDVDVASQYNANVACNVVLTDRRGRTVFSQSVAGDKVHPGAAQVRDGGATAPLINDSEHRLAVQFLASQMMASVYQRMVDTF